MVRWRRIVVDFVENFGFGFFEGLSCPVEFIIGPDKVARKYSSSGNSSERSIKRKISSQRGLVLYQQAPMTVMENITNNFVFCYDFVKFLELIKGFSTTGNSKDAVTT
uniref:Uncharacterized protein n=1 Tax=Romanomermis culicivorax TaxID=13658 RepID=A0A915IUI2_ROMCU